MTKRTIELSGRGGWYDAAAAMDWLVENGVCFPEGSTIEASRLKLHVRIINGDKWCVLEPDHVLNVKVLEVGPEGGPLLPPGPRGGPVAGTGQWVAQPDYRVQARHVDFAPEVTVNARCAVEPWDPASSLELNHRRFTELVRSYRKNTGGFLVPSGVAADINNLTPRAEAYLVDGKPLVTVITDEASVNWPVVRQE